MFAHTNRTCCWPAPTTSLQSRNVISSENRSATVMRISPTVAFGSVQKGHPPLRLVHQHDTDRAADLAPGRHERLVPLLLRLAVELEDLDGLQRLENHSSTSPGLMREQAVLNRGWPKTVAQFARELHRIAPQLRTHGMSISFSRHGKRPSSGHQNPLKPYFRCNRKCLFASRPTHSEVPIIHPTRTNSFSHKWI